MLREEIFNHYAKLCKISGLTAKEVRESEFHVCQDIVYISEEQIKHEAWYTAEKLVADIDPKDTHYVAYSEHFRCKIWSGDKELMKGLAKKGFHNFITTDDLFKWRQNKERQ